MLYRLQSGRPDADSSSRLRDGKTPPPHPPAQSAFVKSSCSITSTLPPILPNIQKLQPRSAVTGRPRDSARRADRVKICVCLRERDRMKVCSVSKSVAVV